MVKKIINCILIITMLISLGQWGYADSSISEQKMFELVVFGIINKSEDYRLNDNVTRAEFAAVILRMLQIETIFDVKYNFTDVENDKWYYQYVNTIAATGLMNGYPGGSFRPDDYISYNEIVKVIVASLGYSYVAEQRGGYPDGYVSMGQSIGLLKGVSFTQLPKRADLCNIVYNALDIDMMVKKIGKIDEYEISKGQTFRNTYTDTNKDETLKKGKGIVSANRYSYLNEPVADLRDNQVQIEGRLYYIGDTKAADYLGLEVDFYIREPESGYATIVDIKPTDNNTVFTISDIDYDKTQDKKVYYGDKNEYKSLSDSLKYIFNGVPQYNYKFNDIKVDAGELILIDNDNDRKFDIAFRSEYSYVRVKNIKNNRIFFIEGQTQLNQMLFDFDDDDINYIILNRDGEEIEFSDIKEEDILSIMSNEYNTLHKIIVSDKIVEGVIDETTIDKLVILSINGDEYTIPKTISIEANAGDEVKAFLNEKNQIIDLKKASSTEKYGYITGVNIKGLDKARLELLIPGKLSVEYDVDDSDPDNVKKTPYLKGHNSDLTVLELSSNMEKQLSTIEQNRLIKYRLNSDGEISRIEYPKVVGREVVNEKRKYNGYDRTFGGYKFGAFGTDDDTQVICIPSNTVNSKDDYYAMVDISNASEYVINGYDIEDGGSIVRLVVIKEYMQHDSKSDINLISDKISVVSDIRTIVNKDGDSKVNLTFYTNGVKRSYEINQTALETAKQLKFGDVFYYKLNPIGEIGVLRVIAGFSQKPAMNRAGEFNDAMTPLKPGMVAFGKINDVKYKQLLDAENKYIDETLIYFDNNGSDRWKMETEYRNPPAIYIVNMNKKTVEVGSRDDLIYSSSNEYIFVHATSSKVRGIVLFKY